jgi:hypothetical protein
MRIPIIRLDASRLPVSFDRIIDFRLSCPEHQSIAQFAPGICRAAFFGPAAQRRQIGALRLERLGRLRALCGKSLVEKIPLQRFGLDARAPDDPVLVDGDLESARPLPASG